MKKWMIVTVYSIAAMLSSAAWTLFVPIASKSSMHYHVSLMDINWLSLLFLALYIPGSIVSIILSSKTGLRPAMILSCAGMFTGLWLKYFAEIFFHSPNFPLVFIGQFIVAITSPILTNASPRVSAVWMPVHQRDIAIVIMNMCSFFGMSVGTAMGSNPDFSIPELLLIQAVIGTVIFVLALLLFDEAPPHPPSASENYRRSLGQQSAASVSTSNTPRLPKPQRIETITTNQESVVSDITRIESSVSVDSVGQESVTSIPESSPSFSQARARVSPHHYQYQNHPIPIDINMHLHRIESHTTTEDEEVDSIVNAVDKAPINVILWKLRCDMMECFSNRSFLLLCLSTFLIGGVYNGVVVLVEAFAASIGYGSEEAGMFSNALVLSGIVTSFLLGLILDRTHAYATSYKLLFVFASVSTIGLTYCFRPGELSSILVMFCLLGAFTTPNAIVAFSLGAELSFPIKEDVSATIIASISQISGVPFTIILGELLELQSDYDPNAPFEYKYTPAYFFLFLSMMIGTILTMFIVEDNKRQRIEDDSGAH